MNENNIIRRKIGKMKSKIGVNYEQKRKAKRG